MEEEPITFNPPASAELINVNFDFIGARPEFDQCIRPYLSVLFDPQCPVVPLADYIANQSEIGTFLVTDASEKPEDSIIGFITLLPIIGAPPLNYPHIYLGAKGDISSINNHPSALLICERVINMPTELIPHLHNQLILDLSWAEENCEGRFNYEYIITLSRCVSTLSSTGSARKKRRGVVPDNLLFFRLEDEILLKYSEESFLFEIEANRGYFGANNASSGDETCSHKLVMILTKDAYIKAVQEMTKAYSPSS